jgi:hypothetical protein
MLMICVQLQELYTQEHNSREEVIHKLLEEKDRLQKCIKRLQIEDGEASNADLAKGIEEVTPGLFYNQLSFECNVNVVNG